MGALVVASRRVMSQAEFDEAVKFTSGSDEMGKKATNDEKLKCYGLFKQANVGDVNIDCPSMFSPTDRSKWFAWEACKGKSKEDAMKEYVEEVKAQRAKYGL